MYRPPTLPCLGASAVSILDLSKNLPSHLPSHLHYRPIYLPIYLEGDPGAVDLRAGDRPKRSCLRDDDDDDDDEEEEDDEEDEDDDEEEACPGLSDLWSSPLALGTPAVRRATASWTSG